MKPVHVFIDIDTQRDFLTPDGAFTVADYRTRAGNLRKVFALIRSFHVPVVSSLNTHRVTDWFAGLPPHCLEGTPGQQKLDFTMLSNRTLVDANNTLDLPPGLLSNFRQIILRKRTPDFLENPKADRLLSLMSPERFVLFGVGMELSIKKLALSLIARGKQLAYVPDACGCWNETDAELAQRLIEAKGGMRLSLDELKSHLQEAASRRRVSPLLKQIAQRNRRRPQPPRPLAG